MIFMHSSKFVRINLYFLCFSISRNQVCHLALRSLKKCPLSVSNVECIFNSMKMHVENCLHSIPTSWISIFEKNVLSKNFMQCKNAAKFFKINLYIVLYISEFHQVMCINLHFDYWKKFFRKFPVQPCLWNWTFALKNCVSCCEVCQMNFYVWKMLVKITCSHVVQSFT